MTVNMRKLELSEIKDIELNLLTEFDKLCRKNHLYYTLSGGTLLGAIRHKGFIPWDDDIDVMMPRPDYDRLLNDLDIDKSGLPEHMRLASWKNGEINYPFIKLVDTRTKISVDYYNPEYDVDSLWIDIFPIDGNPSDEKQLRRIQGKSKLYRKILCLRMAKEGEGKTFFKRMFKPVLIRLLSFVRPSVMCRRIDALARSYDFEQSEYAGCIVWGYGPGERMHKANYLKPMEVEFEGRTFIAPASYDEYLTGLYHNYMQLPPEDKRKVHGIDAYMKQDCPSPEAQK